MTEKQSDNLARQIADSAKQLNLEAIDWRRPPSQTDIEYLIDHCPFLQIIDTSSEPTIEPEVKIIKADSRWNIHYYGDAMSSSPGLFLIGGGDYRIRFQNETRNKDDEGGEGGEGGGARNPGKGTFRNQAYITAIEMIAIAKKMGWKGIRIIDGHPLMKWAAALAAHDYDLPVYGYDASEYEEQKRKRVKRSRAELEMVTGYTPKIR